ncbi:MAG: GDP-mannose 4,6-dehydratase, partial [Bacteroidales bacterium]|nr:GDP-mannose 4,6-dehydratase [Bacteroidales bacterium]
MQELNSTINIIRGLVDRKALSKAEAQKLLGLDDDNFSFLFEKSLELKGDIKNILVCGGAGFIGSNFIRHMLETHPNYKIVNYDKLTYAGNLENLRDVENNPNYTFV